MNISFGTDGIRAEANTDPMTAETMLAMARAISRHLLKPASTRKPQVVIGKDTRLSGYMLETAFASGLISEGIDVIYTGPIPTPAIPCLIKSHNADLGIMLTASHNPWFDNGMKVFDANGEKIGDEHQQLLSTHIGEYSSPAKRELGHAIHSPDARRRYIEHVKSAFARRVDLTGLRIVVDCAHGAAYRVAPDLLNELKPTELVVLHNSPDGRNINANCGATDTQALQGAVQEHKADIGLAFDGDADRLIVVNQHGKVINGDQIIAAIARHWVLSENFDGDVVFSVMSNLALDRCLQGMGLRCHRTPVGDRHVVAKMRELRARLGGEQSGHMIFRDFGHTGDGIMTALAVLDIMQHRGISAAEIGHSFVPMPQTLVNIPRPEVMPDLESIGNDAKKLLGANSQLLLRPSGTEPLIRIMVQTEDTQALDATIKFVEKAILA